MGSVLSMFAWRQQRIARQQWKEEGARADEARYEWFEFTRNFLTEGGRLLTVGETGTLDRSRARKHLRNHRLISSVFIDETAALGAVTGNNNRGGGTDHVWHMKLIASPGSKVEVIPLRIMSAKHGGQQQEQAVYVPKEVIAPRIISIT